jgi:hypothetical protein
MQQFAASYTRANQIRSGARLSGNLAARPGILGGALNVPFGLSDPHLADEVYGEWAYLQFQRLRDAVGICRISRVRSIPLARTETWIGVGASLSVSTPKD